MPKISVIMAAYRGEKYIGSQLKSLFAQTRTPDEILIGDDSDTDATFHAVEAVKDLYAGEFRYIRNPHRLGFVRNFLHLAQEARGDLIFFCDQDDIWLPEKIEVLARILESDPTSEVAVCRSEMVDPDLNSLHKTPLDDVPDLLQKTEAINAGKGFFCLLNQTIGFQGHNIAMKRSFLSVFRQIPASYEYHDLWICHTAGFFGVLRFVDQVLTLYRIHDRNASTPCVRNVRHDLLHRFKEIRSSSGDVFGIARQLNDLVVFMEQNSPENPNRELLTGYCRYFNWRAELLQTGCMRRLLLLCRHPGRFRDYYRYGFGARSLVRDLIVKADRPRFEK